MLFTILWAALGIGSVKADNTYTISWNVSGSVSTETLPEGTAIVPPSSTPICDGKAFMGWTEQTVISPDGSDFIAIADFGTATEDKTYYAVFAERVEIAKSTYKATLITSQAELEGDGLYIIENEGHVAINTVSNSALQTTSVYTTADLIGNEAYVWKFVATALEGRYYIQSAKNTVQISNTTSTTISLLPQGALYTITYQDPIWNIQGPDSRSLGYTTEASFAYKAYKDINGYPHNIHLYKLSKETEVVFQNYSTTCSRQVATPMASLNSGTYLGEQTICLTCATENAIIHYTTDGSEPTETSATYNTTSPIRATESFTLKARAYAENMEPSAILIVTYDIDLGYATSIAGFIARAPQETYELRLTSEQEAIITGTVPSVGYIYLQDRSNKGMMIYCGSDANSTWLQEATVGTKIVGTLKGIYYPDYTGHARMLDTEWGEDISFITSTRPEPILITSIDEATFNTNPLMLVKIENVTFVDDTHIINEEGDTFRFLGTTFNVTTNKTLPESTVSCDITGILAHYAQSYAIMPCLITDIDTKGATAELPAFTPEGGITQEEATETFQVIVTPAENTTITFAGNSYSKQQTIHLTEEYMEIQVVSQRDFYADNAITQWYKAGKMYRIQWCVNGTINEELTKNIVAGQPIETLPNEPVACSEKVFVGWTDTESVSQDGTDLQFISSETVPSEDAIYYAVFAKKIEKGNVLIGYSDFSTICVDTPSETKIHSETQTLQHSAKIITNGQLILICGDQKYNAQGMLITE